MQLVYNLLVVLHLLGMATILGGLLATRLGAGEPRAILAALYGAATQVVTGLALVLWRRPKAAGRAGLPTLAGLTLANVFVAALWT